MVGGVELVAAYSKDVCLAACSAYIAHYNKKTASMNSISNIQSKVADLHQTLQLTDIFRHQWANDLKSRLMTRLKFVRDNVLPHHWYVVEQSDETNRESVFLSMPNMPSGIFDKVNNSHYTRYGGYLQFAQTLNGQIAVLVWYPYVEKITTRKPTETINTLSPNQFNDPVIDEFVEAFIGKMVEWFQVDEEKLPVIEPIGFKMSKPPVNETNP